MASAQTIFHAAPREFFFGDFGNAAQTNITPILEISMTRTNRRQAFALVSILGAASLPMRALTKIW